ncbi:MAG: hypothetical protein DWQ05_15750 [Calditrichaeota bacterium]|nr:MAG: hypothetical protein DWQ05_15750 [Calditrichota bacterium]
MLQKGLFLFLLLAFAFGSTGCDKVKGVIKKGKNSFVEKEQSEKPSENSSNKKQPPKKSEPEGDSENTDLNDDSTEDSETYQGAGDFKNEPITYSVLGPGQFGLLLKKFNNQLDGEDYSRKLRRERINNYIMIDEDSRKYLVLTGKFVTRSLAEKQARYFERNGYDVEVYSAR